MHVYQEHGTSRGRTLCSVSAAKPSYSTHYSRAALPNGGALNERSILELQRTVGNRAVQRLMASRQAASQSSVDPEIERSITQARGSGQNLDPSARTNMESAFGTDFGGVRVHTDQRAHALNRAVGAVAFTTGQDIFFSQGAYSPHSSEGRGLLAHELTHVVQQRDAVQTKLVLGQPGDVYEQEADRVAAEVVQQTSATPEGQVQRKCAECEEEEKGAKRVSRMVSAAPSLWLPRKSTAPVSVGHFAPAMISRENMFDCARMGVPCPPATFVDGGVCSLIGCSRAKTANLPFAISPGICIFRCDDGRICTCVLVGSSASAICTFKFCSSPGTSADSQDDFDNLAIAALDAYQQQQGPVQSDDGDTGTATA